MKKKEDPDANLTKTDHTLIKEVAEDLDKIKLTL